MENMSTLSGKKNINSVLYAQNLKAIRTALGISSVDKLAQKIGITARSLGEYERGGRLPSIELVTRLCTRLNINANWFVTGNGEMFIEPNLLRKPKDDIVTRVENIEKILLNEGLYKKYLINK